jgi:GAF domain-containing protein
MNNLKTEENILKLSTNLQCGLIRKLSTAPNFDKLMQSLLKDIVIQAHNTLKAESCSIIIVDDPTDRKGFKKATMQAGTGYNELNVGNISYKIVSSKKALPAPEKEEKLGLTGWVISTGIAFLSSSIKDLNEHPHHIGKGVPVNRKLGAFLAVPLRNPRGVIIGAFKAERLEGSAPFSPEEQMYLETFAQIAGRCIAHLEDAKTGYCDTAVIAWVLDIISEAVSSEGELDSFLDITVQVISAASLADSCSVFLIDEHKKSLTQRAGCGSQVLRRVIRSYQLPDINQLEELENIDVVVDKHKKIGLTSWIALTGRPFYARNFEELSKHPHHRGQFDPQNFQKDKLCGSFYGVPLRVGGTIIGVLKIENVSLKDKVDDREFSEEIRSRVDALAPNVALAIKRLQLQGPSRYRIILNARPTIFGILRGDLNVSDLVRKIVRETAKLFNARACALFLKEGNQLIQPEWAAVGWNGLGPKIRKYDLVKTKDIMDNPKESEKVGLTVWIAVKKESFTAKSNLELTAHPHHRGTYDRYNFKKEEQCESFMGVPLVVGNELLGVLKVETKMKKAGTEQEFAYFSEQDELVFEFIANSAAIAIQNARLMESRFLADKVLAQPDCNKVMQEIYAFVQGRAEVRNTLKSTAEIVKPKSETKGTLIDELFGLLNPQLNPQNYPPILNKIKEMLNSPIRNVLEFIEAAIRIKNRSSFKELHIDQLRTASVLSGDFFLHNCAEILLDSYENILESLKKYEEDPVQRKNLQKCLQVIEEKENIIGRINPFEKSFLENVFVKWKKIIENTLSEFHRIPNPYIAGRPLPPGSRLFVGRHDIFSWVENKLNHDQNNVMVLHGGGRTGKTSILKQLQAGPLGRRLRERERYPIFPVFVDLHKFADTGTKEFLLSLAETIIEDVGKQGINNLELKIDEFNSAHYRAFDHFLKHVVDTITAEKNGILVIMLDEFETLEELVNSKKIEPEIFKYFRSLMQHQPAVTFILAGHHSLDDLSTVYKDLIFNVALHKEVGFLNVVDAKKLIFEPVSDFGVRYEEKVVERILHLTGGHPYFIQQICQFCIDNLNDNKGDYEITHDHLDDAVETSLGRGSTVTLESLWQSAGKNGQKILKRLVFLADSDAPWICEDDLVQDVKKAGIRKTQIPEVLNQLVKRQLILREHSSKKNSTRYRFAMDLMRLYVIRQR